MNSKIFKVLSFALLFLSVEARAQDQDRWEIGKDGSIIWNIDERVPHSDHLEMSGERISVVLRYGVKQDGSFSLNRDLVLPKLRLKPNKTQSNLMQRFDLDIPGMITADGLTLAEEKVSKIIFNGIMTVESSFSLEYKRKLNPGSVSLKRTLFPSTAHPYYLERYQFRNTCDHDLTMRIPSISMSYVIPENKGQYGEYRVGMKLSKSGIFTVRKGESLDFYAVFGGQLSSDEPFSRIDADAEEMARRSLVDFWWSNLVLDTPDDVLDRMFAFAKVRGAESIYTTRNGLMHGPGGEAYYAAIWANDQAEYIGPFLPYLGYHIGNSASLNAYRQFARYMNDSYRPIPSSIISEGAGIWHGAKDRGDGAMIAYGASRYALARGSRTEAEELWPLIEWCLEYCRRQLTEDQVVASNSDELENRFPAGKANLCTSSLYYDALNSASMLARELGKPKSQIADYEKRANQMHDAIEKYFGYEIEGYHSYRYYEGNDILRSWICIPLTMGIYDRAEGTIDALFSSRLWTAEGMLTQAGTDTYWDRSTLYGLRGTLAAGEVEKGLTFLKRYSRKRLLGDHVPYAIEAWPEGNQRHLSAESGLYCRIFTEGLFGIRPVGLRSFNITPRLPKEWNYANLDHVRAFESDFDIRIRRSGGKLEVCVMKDGSSLLRKSIKEGTTIRVDL